MKPLRCSRISVLIFAGIVIAGSLSGFVPADELLPAEPSNLSPTEIHRATTR